MRKQERAAYIRQRAREMALTGEYAHYRVIELHLRTNGYPEARQVLDDSFIRKELNAICEGRNPHA